MNPSAIELELRSLDEGELFGARRRSKGGGKGGADDGGGSHLRQALLYFLLVLQSRKDYELSQVLN